MLRRSITSLIQKSSAVASSHLRASANVVQPHFALATRGPSQLLSAPRFFSDEVPPSGDPNIKTGTVKWFNYKKGFGFIVPDDGSDDVFVHFTAVHSKGFFKSLADGEKVEFGLKEGNIPGKMEASDVTGPDGDYVQGRAPDHDDRGGYDGGRGGGNDGWNNQGGGGGGGERW